MNDLHLWQTVWFFVLAFLLAGYSVLDGFDLGIGMLSATLDREEDKGQLLGAIAPFWDGNEVWLLTAGASLFAAFPFFFATLLSGFYLVFVIVVLALILRAVSFEFWAHDIVKRRPFWSWVFSLCSLLVPFLLGDMLGNVIQGVPINYHGEVFAKQWLLVRPLPVAAGLLVVACMLLHGAAFAALKVDGPAKERALRIARRAWIVAAALLVAFVILACVNIGGTSGRQLFWIWSAFSAACLGVYAVSAARGRPVDLFGASAAVIVGLWCIAVVLQFPNLLRPLGNSRHGMSVYNSSSSLLSLQTTAVAVLIGSVAVIAYTVFVYRIFKGKSIKGY
jgi:cytochrome bd ubiquinol oxidase subunit II